MNVTAHQEKEENEETKKGMRVAGEKRKRKQATELCAALLRSLRGQHSEKMKESAWGNWDPREGQQPFRPNANGTKDRTTTLRRLLIGAVPNLSFTILIIHLFPLLRHYNSHTNFHSS